MNAYTLEDFEKAIQIETMVRTLQFLAELTDDAAIQTLCYLLNQDGQSQKEFARKLGVSEAAVSQRLTQLRKKLPQLWAQIHDGRERG